MKRSTSLTEHTSVILINVFAPQVNFSEVCLAKVGEDVER